MNFAVVVGAGVSSTPYGVSDSACGVTPSPRPRGADALFEILRSPDPDPYPYPYPASASRVVLGETLVARRRLVHRTLGRRPRSRSPRRFATSTMSGAARALATAPRAHRAGGTALSTKRAHRARARAAGDARRRAAGERCVMPNAIGDAGRAVAGAAGVARATAKATRFGGGASREKRRASVVPRAAGGAGGARGVRPGSVPRRRTATGHRDSQRAQKTHSDHATQHLTQRPSFSAAHFRVRCRPRRPARRRARELLERQGWGWPAGAWGGRQGRHLPDPMQRVLRRGCCLGIFCNRSVGQQQAAVV